ncbi:MAG TPA: aminoglycoside phosphotransferase family protein [Galbitalea sp.]|jgi:aminoglycoside phosphotransferase (APT) family kinase protein
MTSLPEPEIDTALVARLVAEQFPEWAHLPITPVEHGGWDNRTFHLGDAMSVRLPSADGYVPQVEKEQRWLPVLAPQLPLPIPNPVGLGHPSPTFSRPWSVYGWLGGTAATRADIPDLRGFAATLGRFLVALRGVDATDGPLAGDHSFQRGGSLDFYDEETRRALETLNGVVDVSAATAVWDAALATTWTLAPVWFHGDISDGNLLVQGGRLSAVIDFGTSGVGDPACDLVIAWTFFDEPSRAAFRDAVELDDDTWSRARGWAIWKALIVAAGFAGTNSPGGGRALRVISELTT